MDHILPFSYSSAEIARAHLAVQLLFTVIALQIMIFGLSSMAHILCSWVQDLGIGMLFR